MTAKTRMHFQPRPSGLLICALICSFFISGIALAQKPGAYYWADSSGNGIIEIDDVSALVNTLGDPTADDAINYQGHPQSRFRQELDGNGLIEVPDLSILLSWLSGNFASRPGNPGQLLLDGDTHLNLNIGDDVTLSAYALSPASAGAKVRTGFGVIFKIDPSSTCTTAQVFGYDVTGGATVNTWRDNAAYHYTLKPGAPDNGRATVRVNATGCSHGQTIVIAAYIPDDTEAGVAPGRFPDQLPAPEYFLMTVQPASNYWIPIARNVPEPRFGHIAVWTGSEMIVWGGDKSYDEFTNTGGRYDPSTDSWKAVTTSNAPAVRVSHTAVWTGNVMIIWGGYSGSHFNPYFLATGGRYDPSTDSWTATTTTNAPEGRGWHSAVWTGTEMIVWGGYGSSQLNTGGRYNPETDEWTATSTTDAPSVRVIHTAVWTGTEMIIWGGVGSDFTNTGGRYDPATDSWSATSTTNAPSARIYHTAIWTGNEMIVWGGYYEDALPPYNIYYNTGGKYNPATDSWVETTTTNAPSARADFSTVWTETEMIVWGGRYRYEFESFFHFNNGGRYDPASDSWTETSTTNAPVERAFQSAVWTGTEMIVWGGWDGGSVYNSGGRYDPSTDSWTATSNQNGPSARMAHSAVWTGIEMIVWGGFDSTSYLHTGGKYDPVTDSWSATTAIDAPAARRSHSSVWTGTEMIVWGGVGNNSTHFATGGRYNPSTDSWIATTTTNAPDARFDHVAVWTGEEMIIWGGDYMVMAHNFMNTGGRYDPDTDSWTATSTSTNCPSPRDTKVVWTGTEMIVWGGWYEDHTPTDFYYNDGGRYDPSTDTWTATSTGTNVPSPREANSAVWTGTEMIVWGGYKIDGSFPSFIHHYYDSGGRYNPITDSWTTIPVDANTPTARAGHTAVWTGARMIVWGGVFYEGVTRYYDDVGGRYNPSTNSWLTTTTINVPAARTWHTSVWTGTEMVIWGGGKYPVDNNWSFFDSGGRYVP